ncbi:MAG: OmpH family outer membrane protein, partial [Pseudohongiellaceae bacterium]
RIASRMLLALLLAGCATVTLAQESMKVAVLDMNAALFNSEVAKQVDAQVRQETAEDEQKVRALAEEATALQEKLQNDASTMSDDEKRKSAEQIEEIGVQYQFLVQKIQNLVQERRQQFQQTYAPNLIQAITTVVEEGGYDLVLRSEAALHFRTDYDITARVTEKLNAAPAPAAQQ